MEKENMITAYKMAWFLIKIFLLIVFGLLIYVCTFLIFIDTYWSQHSIMFVGPTALWHWIGKEGKLVRDSVLFSAQTYPIRICIISKPTGGWCSQYSGISALLEKGLGLTWACLSPREYDRHWRESIGLEGARSASEQTGQGRSVEGGKSNHEHGAFIYFAKLTFKNYLSAPAIKWLLQVETNLLFVISIFLFKQVID